MHDDLARSQRASPLEWFVANMVIPSVLVTFALQARAGEAVWVLRAELFCRPWWTHTVG